MPTKQLKTWAKKAGKTVEEAEGCWEKAVKQANKIYPKGEADHRYWGFVNNATRKCLGLLEDKSKKISDW